MISWNKKGENSKIVSDLIGLYDLLNYIHHIS